MEDLWVSFCQFSRFPEIFDGFFFFALLKVGQTQIEMDFSRGRVGKIGLIELEQSIPISSRMIVFDSEIITHFS